MSLVITQRPEQTISGETSRWNAVGNPIVYKMQRRDYNWTVLSDNGGFARILIFGVDVTSDFPNGTEVLVVGDAGTINFTSTVTGNSFSGGNTYVTFAEPYTIGSSANGFVNKLNRLLYRVEINIYDSNDVLLNSSPFPYSPDSKGELTVNVASIAKSNLSPENNINLNSDIVYNDTNVYQPFYIGYTEVWNGSAESETQDDSNVFYGVFASMQIPSAYGGNMAKYVTFEDGTPKGLFLNKFTRPKMWRGYPFAFSLIVGEDISVDTYFNVQYFDISGNIVGSQGSVNDDYSGTISDFIPSNMLVIPSDAVYGRVWLTNNDTSALITDYLYFDIVDPCNNPVYIMTRNSLGGVIQWLFDYSQEYTHDYGNGRKAKRLVCAVKGLTINEWESLQDFIGLGEVYKNNIVEFTSSTNKTSSRIGKQVYQVFPDGSKIGLIVVPTQNSTLTKQVKHTFTLEIEYPEEFMP